IDYTASNKYQGEDSFGGRSLHTIHPNIMNPYQQVITILGRTLAPFASTGCIPVYGFGDAKTGDWSVFPLKQNGDCRTLEEVL
ncbi:Copine, partial [Ostertagia ostertagi]